VRSVDTGSGIFRSGVDLVSLNVIVTDAKDKFVTGLTQRDFAVFEDGVQQDLSFFAAANVPLDLAIPRFRGKREDPHPFWLSGDDAVGPGVPEQIGNRTFQVRGTVKSGRGRPAYRAAGRLLARPGRGGADPTDTHRRRALRHRIPDLPPEA